MQSDQLDNGCCGGSCGPEGAEQRPDRPHTFFAHEMTRCASCERDLEARVVLRDGEVFHLIFCPDCGESEAKIGDDAKQYVSDFIAGGKPKPGTEAEDHHFKQTTSTCPECLQLLTVDVVIRDGRVYFKKDCPKCGPSEALVSENAEYYVDAYRFAKAGTEPFEFSAEVSQGCPTDCGTCGNHEQHTCLPIVEITDHCNLECPVCIVNNLYSNHMDPDDFQGIVDNLIESEGFCESIALSGGEPTSHPQFWEFVDIATRDEIGRVVVITNGLRLGRDREFAQKLKETGAYVALQFDGFSPEAHTVVRGRDLTDEKQAALDMLKEFEIPTQIIFVAVRGVNEHQVGEAVELLLSEDHFLSLSFQPLAHSGHGGGDFEHDPMDRLTIPGVIERVEEQTDGKLKLSDFNPLPCSHPQCVSLTYLLELNDGSYVPFPRFVDFEQHGSLLRSSATLVSSPEMQDTMLDVIHETFARQDDIERGPEILKALRRCVDEMFPPRALDAKEAMRIGEGQAKSIFLHHYMDRHDFDLERLRKCCHHYAEPDGRIMPACGFNMFHRGAAKGPKSKTPSWGKAPAIQRGQTSKRRDLRANLSGADSSPANTSSSCGSGCGCD
jgi:uncharacterized radical SAM superfamily Fe-S cluster-containing enzyme